MIALRTKFKLRFCGDVFSARATTIVIACLCAFSARADLDYNLGLRARTYPLAGSVDGDIGYGFLLWGNQSAGNPFYGYLRPHVGASNAGYYNSAVASLDVFPLSFLGISGGGESIQNDKDYQAYDCSRYQCRGRSYRNFVQAELSLASGPLFGQLLWKRERWSLANPGTREFIDSTSGLSLNPNGDSQTMYRGALGVKLGERWSLAGIYAYTQSDNSREVQRFPFAVLRYKIGQAAVGVAAGVYSSTLKAAGGSGMVFLTWNIKPGLPLGQ